MKVGDLVEIYRHIPRYESGEIQVGKMGIGVIVDISSFNIMTTQDHPKRVSYITPDGSLKSEWVGDTEDNTCGAIVTMKVIDENR